MGTYLRLIVVLFLCTQYTHGQNDTIEHVIQKGENVYRLSLRYNVSINDIYRLNPESKNIIKAGEILLIPKNKTTVSKDTSENPQNYLVSKGETKYGISKTFGISITELENANPFIRNGLQAGHNLKIPVKENSNYSNKKPNQHIVVKGETLWGISQKYNMSLNDLMSLNKVNEDSTLAIGEVLLISENQNQTRVSETYLVKKGDTKYGLSKQFGLSISELERLNPEITDMLRTGTIIQLESPKESVTKKTDPLITNTLNEVKTGETLNLDFYIIKPKETIYSIAKKAGITNDELIALNPKLKTSVLAGDTIRFPNYAKQDITKTSTFVKQFKTDIFWSETSLEDNAKFTENANDYLKGLNHAVTSAKSKHPEMILNLINLKQSDSLLFEGKNDSLTHYKIKPTPTFNIDNDANIQSTFIISEVDKDTSNTITIKGIPSKKVMQNKMISYLNNKNGKVICLYDNEHSDNLKSIKNTIPNIELIRLNRNDQFKEKDLKESLDSEVKNFVIIESSKVGVFLSASSLLLKESSNHKIQLIVLNPKNIPDSSKISYNRFKILNLAYPMFYNPNYLKENTVDYKMAYLISSDILNRLKANGIEAFKNETSTSVLGTVFKYDYNDNSAENKAVSIFMFNDNSDAYLIETY
ncbi:LysM peptidoglycan-binding domain-containing protein [Psychroserpens mesophilus]|uniref:LysM peptidoglycan-binding domain-containing protein n=1 Tax=Psychroserpens mesophilus TaxID=325473 RepID=UPI003D64EF3C